MVLYGGAGHQVAALDVDADCLGRMEFENRNVLVRSGMEYYVRPGRLKSPIDVRFMRDVAKERHRVQSWVDRAQILIDVEEVRVVPFQQDQQCRVEPGELAAELRANRAAGARDHDALAGKHMLHLARVHLHRLLAGQLMDGNAFQRADICPVINQIRHGRNQPYLEFKFVESLIELPDCE